MAVRLEFIALLVGQTILTLFIRHVQKSWYAPAALFALIWNFIICFSVLSAPDYYFSFKALLLIVFFMVVFFVGSRIEDYTASLFPQRLNAASQIKFDLAKIETILKFGIVSGFFALLFLLKESGLSLMNFTNLDRIAEASFKVSSGRYEGVRLSSFTMLFLTISYMTSFGAGLLLANKPGNRQKLLVGLLILPILLFTVFYTARSTLLFMLVIIGGAYFAFRPYFLTKDPVLFNRRNVVYGFLGVIILFGVFVISQAFRMKLNIADAGQFTFITNYLKVWFSGNISGFCSWFDVDFNPNTPSHEFYSLAGLSEWFGVAQRKAGIYDIAIDVNHEMVFSNIYTLFRFVIDDLGLSGSFLFFLFLGFASSYFFRQSKKGSLASASLLSGIIAMLLFSFITSIWAYNSILFGWIGFTCWCFYSEKLT